MSDHDRANFFQDHSDGAASSSSPCDIQALDRELFAKLT
jgi:hypothetical protein